MEKYDLTYQKDSAPMQVGIGLIIVYAIMFYLNTFNADNHITILQISAVLRILLCIWVYNIAKTLNRKPIEWVIFCFFTPAIALIIISTLKKIRTEYSDALEMDQKLKLEYDNDLSLLDKSFSSKLLSQDEYNKSIENLRTKYYNLNLDLKNKHTEVEQRNNKENLLQQLKELRNKNLISEEEYNSKFAEISST